MSFLYEVAVFVISQTILAIQGLRNRYGFVKKAKSVLSLRKDSGIQGNALAKFADVD
jgi:hypothetical protein|tara:strand:- start:148 stop:318 length:171 start_codon:yes stop_codon:yes gene_type:complete